MGMFDRFKKKNNEEELNEKKVTNEVANEVTDEVTLAEELKPLLEKYGAIALEKQSRAVELVGEKNWGVDLETGKATFDDELTFNIQALGSMSFMDDSWLWIWANQSTNAPKSSTFANELRTDENLASYSIFTEPRFNISKEDLHTMGLICSGISEAGFYYIGNYGEGAFLFIVEDEPEAESDDTLKIVSNFSQFISMFNVNHRVSLENYLITKGYSIEISNDEKLVAVKGDNKISATFDELGRLTNLSD